MPIILSTLEVEAGGWGVRGCIVSSRPACDTWNPVSAKEISFRVIVTVLGNYKCKKWVFTGRWTLRTWWSIAWCPVQSTQNIWWECLIEGLHLSREDSEPWKPKFEKDDNFNGAIQSAKRSHWRTTRIVGVRLWIHSSSQEKYDVQMACR